eukprot:4977112-Prymnesium_polylepis.1
MGDANAQQVSDDFDLMLRDSVGDSSSPFSEGATPGGASSSPSPSTTSGEGAVGRSQKRARGGGASPGARGSVERPQSPPASASDTHRCAKPRSSSAARPACATRSSPALSHTPSTPLPPGDDREPAHMNEELIKTLRRLVELTGDIRERELQANASPAAGSSSHSFATSIA